MTTSLSNSLYNAISPYSADSDPQYVDYDTTTSTAERYHKMEDYSAVTLRESDLMITESNNNPGLDELLLALSGTDYLHLPQLSWNEEITQLPCSELLASASDMSSEGLEDNGSDYSDQASCGSYEDSIITDYRNTYPQEPELFTCRSMSQVTFQPDTCQNHNGPSAKKKPGRKKGQTSKVLHLWEFIRDLLKDPAFCGKIIKWENHSEGVFRVVQSSVVADLWGAKKKNKKAMTYEKMSRSMRYSRKEGYFIDLPKNSGYPKKLCFRFGPKSTGWK